MALARCRLVITDEDGNIVDSASIEVRREAGLALEPLFSDRDGAVPIANPFTATDGRDAGFYCAAGAFKITATKAALTIIHRHVAVGTAQEYEYVAGLEEGIKGVHNADIPSATTLNLEPAAGELVDVTGTTAITAITLSDGHEATVRFTGALTLTHGASLVLPGAANILTAAGDFAIFRGYAAGVVRCVSYFRANGQALVAPSQASLMGYGGLINATIAESNVGNAVTFALKTLAGTDPTANDPVQIAFRNATLATGNYVTRSVTAALSLTISSGSTLGFVSGVAGRLWIVLFDDAGTIRLGAINCRSGTNIYPLGRLPRVSSTAEGGAGAADSAHVFYSTAAVTDKPYVIVGYCDYESGLATAGTWNVSPTRIQLFGPGVPLPGATVQPPQRNATGETSNGTTILPNDDTIPQNTEGIEVMTQAITPTSKANVFAITAQAEAASSAGGVITMAIFQDTTADALTGMMQYGPTNEHKSLNINYSMAVNVAAGTATTFKARIGSSSAATTTFNGVATARRLGGVLNSFLEIAEIMA